MTFANEKINFLKKPDKSFAGEVDKEILQLVRKINKSSYYYTTSSCAGRIILMKETGKKQENVFLFISHNKIAFEQLKKAVDNAIKKYNGIVYIKMEPCIMHVASASLRSALRLVNLARNSGWKKSGIISKRNIIEMLSTEHLECPVADKGKVIIDNNYLKILAKECNSKLLNTTQKIKQLEKELKPKNET
jgi:tRNA wybutosine-synthesizing protein 3